MAWRPEGLEYRKEEIINNTLELTGSSYVEDLGIMFDGGVDAVLDALKKEVIMTIEYGQVVETNMGSYRWFKFEKNGYLVFIPKD